MSDINLNQLLGLKLPSVKLQATNAELIDLSELPGLVVVYAYPRTSPPNVAPIEGWDLIPGARGCTPQSCAFRDHFEELRSFGATAVFGLSTQSTDYQSEVVERLHLPFSVLSDEKLEFARAINLPTFEAGGLTLLRRLTLIAKDGVLKHVMYPITEPSKNAEEVIAYLKGLR